MAFVTLGRFRGLLRRPVLRELSTVTFSKTGPALQVLTMGPDADVKSLGDSEVAVKFLAASISPGDLSAIEGSSSKPSLPAVAGSSGVAVVTATGSGVTSLKPNDWVVPAVAGIGEWLDMHILHMHKCLVWLFVDIPSCGGPWIRSKLSDGSR
jgi:hypothetical protein